MPATLRAQETFNLKFIRGSASGNVPAIFSDAVQFPSGDYVLDIYLNQEKVAMAQSLTISPQESEKLCLSFTWLQQQNIFIRPEFYQPWFLAERECYELANDPDSRVELDQNSQSLRLSLPQAALQPSAAESQPWDYGNPGMQLGYSINTLKSRGQGYSHFAGVDGNLNYHQWVLSFNANSNLRDESRFNSASLNRSLQSLKADFIVGKTQNGYSPLIDGFSFYGVQLRSNASMLSWQQRNYAPTILGIAGSQARVTIEQNGRVLQSLLVPPGPFEIRDINTVASGELLMTVREESGRTYTERFPVTVIPNLLRPKTVEFEVAIGRKADDRTDEGSNGFSLWRIDYGFDALTLNTLLLLHPDYLNVGLGTTFSLGRLGAMGVSGNYARVSYPTLSEEKASNGWPIGQRQHGTSLSARFARNITEYTDFQLIAYRFNSREYLEFKDFDPQIWQMERQQTRNRYELLLSHRITASNTYLHFSGYRENYWNATAENGTNLSVSQAFPNFSLSFNGGYSRSRLEKNNYQLGLSVNVPFNVGGTRLYSNSSVNTRRGSDTQFNSSLSAVVNEHFNMSVNANADRNSYGSGLSGSYKLDAMRLSASVSQRSTGDSSYSLQSSGTLMGIYPGGWLFSNESPGTMMMVDMKGLPGVQLNNSVYTNSKGLAALRLTSYNANNVNINGETLPDNIELLDNSTRRAPSDRALLYYNVKYRQVNRYVLRLYDRNGFVIPMGTLAQQLPSGEEAGFVTNGGVLLLNLAADVAQIRITDCMIDINTLRANAPEIQEIHCE